jgi:hypothetical protein
MVKRFDIYDGEKYDYDDGEYLAYDDYEKLEKQLAELREKLRWIPVSERLPETGKDIEIKTIFLEEGESKRLFFEGKSIEHFKKYVLEWRYIPELGDAEMSNYPSQTDYYEARNG